MPIPGSFQQRSRTITILCKEFREIFRDRRTLISVVISPLIVTPLLFILVGTVVGSQVKKAQARTYSIGIVGAEGQPDLMRTLRSDSHLNLQMVSTQDMENRIKGRQLNAVVTFPPDTGKSSYKPLSVRILLDAGEETSQAAAGRLEADCEQFGEQRVRSRLSALHLPAELAKPIHVDREPIRLGGSAASLFLAMMLPYILVVSSFGGAIYAAFDQVAGEKERNTLETLLVSGASRREIVLGKFGAVTAVCLISSMLSVVGLILAFSNPAAGRGWAAQGGLHLSQNAIAAALLMMLPLAILFAGLLLAVSTFARNQKEAQTYLAPLFMVVLLPAMMSMFLGADTPLAMAVVPVLGASLIIKQALSGNFNPSFIALAFSASLVYAAIALALATSLFQNEKVLIKA